MIHDFDGKMFTENIAKSAGYAACAEMIAPEECTREGSSRAARQTEKAGRTGRQQIKRNLWITSTGTAPRVRHEGREISVALCRPCQHRQMLGVLGTRYGQFGTDDGRKIVVLTRAKREPNRASEIVMIR